MAKTVFILGAGASAGVGAPVMCNFLDVAETLLATNQVGDGFEDDFENVFRGIHALQAVQAKSYIDSRNLEAVFTAFEMAEIVGTLPGFAPDDCTKLIADFRTVICRTLECSVKMAETSNDFSSPVPYRGLAKHLVGRSSLDAAVITFNYDCALDYAIRREGGHIAYCLHSLPKPVAGVAEILKLHGSLNWWKHEDEGIVLLDPKDFRLHVFPDGIVRSRISEVSLADEPVIVPPTWGKGSYYKQLTPVWRRAAHHLSEAENIIVCGYSLPATDEFFHNLLALGSIGKARLRRVWVFDKTPSRTMDQRYRHLLGRDAEAVYAMYGADFKDVSSEIGRVGAESFIAAVERGSYSRFEA